jgi:hypothetical protein
MTILTQTQIQLTSLKFIEQLKSQLSALSTTIHDQQCALLQFYSPTRNQLAQVQIIFDDSKNDVSDALSFHWSQVIKKECPEKGGFGLFATQPIPPNTIFQYGGQVIDAIEAESRIQNNHGNYIVRCSQSKFIDAHPRSEIEFICYVT